MNMEMLMGILGDEGLSDQDKAERIGEMWKEESGVLAREIEGLREKDAARASGAFAAVKPKFFDHVYGMIDKSEGAAPVAEQLKGVRESYGEYFLGGESLGQAVTGSMPTGKESAKETLARVWEY